eukprot:Awhi_evm1s7509
MVDVQPGSTVLSLERITMMSNVNDNNQLNRRNDLENSGNVDTQHNVNNVTVDSNLSHSNNIDSINDSRRAANLGLKDESNIVTSGMNRSPFANYSSDQLLASLLHFTPSNEQIYKYGNNDNISEQQSTGKQLKNFINFPTEERQYHSQQQPPSTPPVILNVNRKDIQQSVSQPQQQAQKVNSNSYDIISLMRDNMNMQVNMNDDYSHNNSTINKKTSPTVKKEECVGDGQINRLQQNNRPQSIYERNSIYDKLNNQNNVAGNFQSETFNNNFPNIQHNRAMTNNNATCSNDNLSTMVCSAYDQSSQQDQPQRARAKSLSPMASDFSAFSGIFNPTTTLTRQNSVSSPQVDFTVNDNKSSSSYNTSGRRHTIHNHDRIRILEGFQQQQRMNQFQQQLFNFYNNSSAFDFFNNSHPSPPIGKVGIPRCSRVIQKPRKKVLVKTLPCTHGCGRLYSSLKSLRNHVRIKHSNNNSTIKEGEIKNNNNSIN